MLLAVIGSWRFLGTLLVSFVVSLSGPCLLSPKAQPSNPAPGMSRIGVAPRTAVTHAQTPQRPQHKSLSHTASRLHRSGCLTRSDRLQQRAPLPQPINSPNPPAYPNTPIPWPKPKPPPPQLSNAGSMLPPLPAGPRLAQHQVFAVPMQSFCSRYQNRTCRRQCALHMSALQRAHAHVFALHGLPAQALMPQVAQARHFFGLSNILACIWAHISPQDRRSFHVIDCWSAADARWYLAGLPMPDSDDYFDLESSSGTSTATSVGA